jgi:hypothetical protein
MKIDKPNWQEKLVELAKSGELSWKDIDFALTDEQKKQYKNKRTIDLIK